MLRSANEEVLSANEEMTTLNDELRHRNNELGLLNSDLVNLLGSIDMPILMIGSDLRIRRLTPSANKVFHIIASDIGRPITDIRSKIDVADMEEAILHVIESLIPTIREVRNAQGQWYSLEMRPYRTVDNKIDGVVLALVDIDQQKRAAEMDKKAKAFSDGIVDTVRQPFLVLDSRLRVVRANEAFYQAFQADPEKTERKPVYELGDGQWNVPELRRLLEEVLPKSQEVRDLEVEREFEGIGRRTMLLSARRVNAFSDGHEALILLAIDDITERKRRGEEYREHMEEMDRSNRAMVDRELRMIGLKKEVNEMLQQKGEAARYPLGFERGEEEISGSPQPGSKHE